MKWLRSSPLWHHAILSPRRCHCERWKSLKESTKIDPKPAGGKFQCVSMYFCLISKCLKISWSPMSVRNKGCSRDENSSGSVESILWTHQSIWKRLTILQAWNCKLLLKCWNQNEKVFTLKNIQVFWRNWELEKKVASTMNAIEQRQSHSMS